MRTLQNLLLTASLLAFATGCKTKVVVVDRQSDWVRLGSDVSGHVYLYQSGQWVRQPDKMKLPEGWVAGPEPSEN